MGSEIEYPFYGPKFEDHNEGGLLSDYHSVEIVGYKPPIFHGSFGKQVEDTRVDDLDNVETLDVKTPIFHGSSKRKAVLEQESFEKSTQNGSNQRERGNRRRKRGRINAASMDLPGLSHFWYQTRSISRIKEEQAEVQEMENANISEISKPKENNNQSCSRHLPVKCEQDVEMIVPRSFSYSGSRRQVFSKETEKAVRAAYRCNIQNPSFMVIVRPTNGCMVSLLCLYLSFEFL